MKFTIKNEKIQKINENIKTEFPKYVTQLINCANQNAQGTRPKVVGQLSELFPEYREDNDNISIESWENWYCSHYPNAIEEATDKIFAQINKLKEVITLIDRNMIKKWVKDLVINKTYNGMYIQKAILATLAEKNNVKYRLADSHEESKHIDGYVGNTPYSIKPTSYKNMEQLSETINVKIIYYEKKKDGLYIEVED